MAVGLLILPGRVHLDRPGEQILAAVCASGQLPEQTVLFCSGGDGVQTCELYPPDDTEMEMRAEEGGAKMRLDTGAVPDHYRLQMLLFELKHKTEDKL